MTTDNVARGIAVQALKLAQAGGGGGGVSIDDASPASTTTTYSASKSEAIVAAEASARATAVALKAPLASPTFTGAPAAPTATAGDNTTKLASTAFVQAAVTAAVTALIGGAPGALDTLKELADAINDDASFAATVTTALALKAPLASPALTGAPTAPNPAAGDNSTAIATTAFLAGAGGVLLAAGHITTAVANIELPCPSGYMAFVLVASGFRTATSDGNGTISVQTFVTADGAYKVGSSDYTCTYFFVSPSGVSSLFHATASGMFVANCNGLLHTTGNWDTTLFPGNATDYPNLRASSFGNYNGGTPADELSLSGGWRTAAAAISKCRLFCDNASNLVAGNYKWLGLPLI